MRWRGVVAVVLMASAAGVAQMPERKALTEWPKIVLDAVKPSFRTFSEAQLRAEIKLVSTRSYAVFGYNTPEVRAQLPKVSNSAYAQIEFGPATLVNAAGAKVRFEPEESGYMDEECASEIRFRAPNSDQLVRFARARGRVKVKYPLAVKTTVVTPAQPGPPELAAKLDGPYVSFAEDEEKTPGSSFAKLKPLRAYDAEGRQLKQHDYSETTTDDSGAFIRSVAFYGNVARVEIDTVESWAELDLPYDLKPAPLLPAGHEGENPGSYEKESPR